MATAKLKVEKSPVILELSVEETSALVTVLSMVGGQRDSTRRKHTEAIATALRSVGYSYSHPDTRDATGSITFS